MTTETKTLLSDVEWWDIQRYIRRFERMPAEEILDIMGELRDFFYEHMTPEGRRFYEWEKYGPGKESDDVDKA
jgi:hypothetical protein